MSEFNFDDIEKLESLFSSNELSLNNESFKLCFNLIFSLLKKQNEKIIFLENAIKNKEQKHIERNFSIEDVTLLINNKIDKINTEIDEIKLSIDNKRPKSHISILKNKESNITLNVLNKKVNGVEMGFNKLSLKIKHDLENFNFSIKNLQKTKVNFENLNKLNEEVKNNRNDIQLLTTITEEIKNKKADLTELNKVIDEFKNYVDNETLSTIIQEINNSINNILNSNNEELKNELNQNFNKFKKQNNEFKQMNNQALKKIDLSIKNQSEKFENILKKENKEFEGKIQHLYGIINKETLNNSNNYNNLNQLIRTVYNEHNSFKLDIQNELILKPYLSDITNLIQNKVDNKTLNLTLLQFNKLKEKIDKIDSNNSHEYKRSYTDSFYYISKYNKNYDINILKNQINEIKDSLKMKINYNEFLNIIKGKASIDDLNKLFEKIQKNYKEMNIIGKWISMKYDLYCGNIKWDIQSQNTSSNDFIWDNYNITIVKEGIYQIQLIIFIDNKKIDFFPNINFIINDNIIKSFNSTQNNITNEIIGIKYIEYINIIKKSKLNISISSNGVMNEFKALLIIKSI